MAADRKKRNYNYMIPLKKNGLSVLQVMALNAILLFRRNKKFKH